MGIPENWPAHTGQPQGTELMRYKSPPAYTVTSDTSLVPIDHYLRQLYQNPTAHLGTPKSASLATDPPPLSCLFPHVHVLHVYHMYMHVHVHVHVACLNSCPEHCGTYTSMLVGPRITCGACVVSGLVNRMVGLR